MSIKAWTTWLVQQSVVNAKCLAEETNGLTQFSLELLYIVGKVLSVKVFLCSVTYLGSSTRNSLLNPMPLVVLMGSMSFATKYPIAVVISFALLERGGSVALV